MTLASPRRERAGRPLEQAEALGSDAAGVQAGKSALDELVDARFDDASCAGALEHLDGAQDVFVAGARVAHDPLEQAVIAATRPAQRRPEQHGALTPPQIAAEG